MWVNMRGDRGDQPLSKLCLKSLPLSTPVDHPPTYLPNAQILLISGILENRTDALPVREELCMSRVFGVFLPGLPRNLETLRYLPSSIVAIDGGHIPNRSLNCQTAGSHQNPSSVKPHANPYDEGGKQHLAFSLTRPVMPRKKVTCIPRGRPPVQAIPARFSVTLTRLL